MKNLIPFESHLQDLQEKKGNNWIAGAIKKPGALKKQLGLDQDEKVTKSLLGKEIGKLKAQDTDPDTPGAQLPPSKAKQYKRLNLAKTLMGLREDHSETENYMFFANIMNMSRMCDAILEMDSHTIDALLKDGHGWAVDHIATSKDDVEEVYNFLYASIQGEEKAHDEMPVDAQEVVISDKKQW